MKFVYCVFRSLSLGSDWSFPRVPLELKVIFHVFRGDLYFCCQVKYCASTFYYSIISYYIRMSVPLNRRFYFIYTLICAPMLHSCLVFSLIFLWRSVFSAAVANIFVSAVSNSFFFLLLIFKIFFPWRSEWVYNGCFINLCPAMFIPLVGNTTVCRS